MVTNLKKSHDVGKFWKLKIQWLLVSRGFEFVDRYLFEPFRIDPGMLTKIKQTLRRFGFRTSESALFKLFSELWKRWDKTK